MKKEESMKKAGDLEDDMLNQGDIQRMSTEQDEDNNHPYLPPPPGEPPSSYYRDESP